MASIPCLSNGGRVIGYNPLNGRFTRVCVSSVQGDWATTARSNERLVAGIRY